MSDSEIRGGILGDRYYRLLVELMTVMGKGEIKIPSSYHSRVKAVKKMIEVDNTGLAATLTGFQINAASVPVSIETKNKQLTKILDAWGQSVNFKMKMVETGIKGLMGQYYKERWQGSSFIVLKTVWENIGDFILPTKMYFLDGESIYSTAKKGEPIIVGNPSYELRYGSKTNDKELLVDQKNIKYFFQNPFGTWGEIYPSPYLISRGVFYNQSFLNSIKEKGASVIRRAVEHLLLLKKGFKEAVLQDRTENIYDRGELEQIDKDLHDITKKKQNTDDMTTYTTNFDTDVEHLIPEYKKILNSEVISPAEKGLLASLGFVEMYSMQTRKEEVFNPKPFIAETQDGLNDFVSLLYDVVLTIVEENKKLHPKYGNVEPIKINTAPITAFIDSEAKKILRSIYDRGGVSMRTLTEIGAGVDYDIELNRVRYEKKEGDRDIMIPNPIQVSDIYLSEKDSGINVPSPSVPKDDIPDDKKGIEKRNFEISTEELENAPYSKNLELPKSVKELPSVAQTVWRKAFNSCYEETEDETSSIKTAWNSVKKAGYAKDSKTGKWNKTRGAK